MLLVQILGFVLVVIVIALLINRALSVYPKTGWLVGAFENKTINKRSLFIVIESSNKKQYRVEVEPVTYLEATDFLEEKKQVMVRFYPQIGSDKTKVLW